MSKRTILRYRWIFLTAAILIVATSLALLSRMVNASQAPSWQFDGLSGLTIHSFAAGHHRTGLLFAGAEDGIYHRDPQSGWHRVLQSEAVWSIELLSDNRTLFAGDQAGNVDVSHDGGHLWRQSRVTPEGVYAVTTVPGTPTHVLAGAGGGLYSSVDGGRHWQRRLALHHAGGSAFIWQPGSTQTLYAGVVATATDGATQVFVSHDAGQHWRIFGQQLGSRGGIMALAVTANRLYAGTMGNLIWSVAPSRTIWRQLPNGLPQNQHVSGIATLPSHAHTLFIATLATGVFRSGDSGSSWHSLSNGLPSSDGQQVVLSVEYSAQDRMLYAGTLNGVYKFALSAGR